MRSIGEVIGVCLLILGLAWCAADHLSPAPLAAVHEPEPTPPESDGIYIPIPSSALDNPR